MFSGSFETTGCQAKCGVLEAGKLTATFANSSENTLNYGYYTLDINK